MAKLPFVKFYTGDWLKDTQLSLCAPATRGVWIDLLCAMHELNRSGELCGTTEQLARVARCSTVEFTQAMTDLQTTGAADVTNRNGEITVKNRRMKREEKDRKDGAERQERFRHNAENNGEVTPYISEVIFQKSEKEEKKKEETPPSAASSFDIFWKLYPRKVGKGGAEKSFERQKCGQIIDQIKNAIKAQMQSKQWKDGFIPNPATWLNQKRWLDEVKTQPQVVNHPDKKSFDQARNEIIAKLEEVKLSDGDAISYCLSVCNDLYRDIPKREGKSVVNEAYEIYKFRNKNHETPMAT